MPENQSPRAKHERRKATLLGLPLLVVLSPFLLVLVATALIARLFQWVVLRLLIVALWAPQRRRGLIVYSNSPHWQEYFERELLPRLHANVAVLNWSNRREWQFSLAVWLFRFYGGSHAFNPLVILIRPFGRLRILRFWEAFQSARHGRPNELQRLEASVIDELEAA